MHTTNARLEVRQGIFSYWSVFSIKSFSQSCSSFSNPLVLCWLRVAVAAASSVHLKPEAVDLRKTWGTAVGCWVKWCWPLRRHFNFEKVGWETIGSGWQLLVSWHENASSECVGSLRNDVSKIVIEFDFTWSKYNAKEIWGSMIIRKTHRRLSPQRLSDHKMAAIMSTWTLPLNMQPLSIVRTIKCQWN